jgi:hypothetical protein
MPSTQPACSQANLESNANNKPVPEQISSAQGQVYYEFKKIVGAKGLEPLTPSV